MATTDASNRRARRAAIGAPGHQLRRTMRPADIPADAPLTDAQERFCQEYLVDCCGTQAAIRAKYSARTARAKACTLLQQPNIQRRVRELIEARNARVQIDQDRALREVAALAFAEMRKIATWDDTGINLIPSGQLDPAVAAAVEEVRHRVTQFGVNVTVKLHPKLPALELLMRHLGMLDKAKGDDDQGDQLAALVEAMNEAARAAAQ